MASALKLAALCGPAVQFNAVSACWSQHAKSQQASQARGLNQKHSPFLSHTHTLTHTSSQDERPPRKRAQGALLESHPALTQQVGMAGQGTVHLGVVLGGSGSWAVAGMPPSRAACPPALCLCPGPGSGLATLPVLPSGILEASTRQLCAGAQQGWPHL